MEQLTASRMNYLATEQSLNLTDMGLPINNARKEALHIVSQKDMGISPEMQFLILYLSQSIDCTLPPWGEMQLILEGIEEYVSRHWAAIDIFQELSKQHYEWIPFIRMVLATKFKISHAELGGN
jgi:hypothetical protein